MPAADLPGEIWAVIGLIAAMTVVMCLAVLANLHAYILRVHRLSDDVRVLRARYKVAFGRADYVPPAADAAVAPEPAVEAEKKAA